MKKIPLTECDGQSCLQTSMSTTIESPNQSLANQEILSIDEIHRQALKDILISIKKNLKERRKVLTLYKQPWVTLMKCSIIASKYISMTARRVFLHPITYGLIIPGIISMHMLQHIQGPHSEFISEVWIYTKLITWWVVLGFLSSVGLGTGMHTGFVFLFPHFFLICTTAEVCNSLDFDPRINMWQYSMTSLKHFECGTHNPSEKFDSEVTFSGLVMKTFFFGILWGLGSALGELPPYAASYASAMASLEDEEFEEIEADLHSKRWGLMKQVKAWTMKLVENYGPISVFFLSSWPNAFFDLCGIICGHFMMPFWKFFIPLAIGKGVVKIFFQCCFFVFLFSSKFDQMRARLFIELANFWPLSSWIIHRYESADNFERVIINEIQNLRIGMRGESFNRSLLSFSTFIALSSVIMIAVLGISFIEKLAQKRQQEIDESNIKKIMKSDATHCEKVNKLTNLSMSF